MLTDMGGTVDSIIRYRYNPMAYETPGGEWTWRVILERRSGGFDTGGFSGCFWLNPGFVYSH